MKNNKLNMIIKIAEELLKKEKIKSRREFSIKYLGKCSNYLGSLIYQKKMPSVHSFLNLYFNLNQKNLLPEWQKKLFNTLKTNIIKDL